MWLLCVTHTKAHHHQLQHQLCLIGESYFLLLQVFDSNKHCLSWYQSFKSHRFISNETWADRQHSLRFLRAELREGEDLSFWMAKFREYVTGRCLKFQFHFIEIKRLSLRRHWHTDILRNTDRWQTKRMALFFFPQFLIQFSLRSRNVLDLQ